MPYTHLRRYPVSIFCLLLAITPLTHAEHHDDLFQLSLAELGNIPIQVGNRSGKNRAQPIDIISAAQLQSTGYADLAKALNQLLSSYTYGYATIDDLSDHVRPFSIHGLKPEHVQVLINGKRVHQSAMVYVNDSQMRGGTGVDLSLFPIDSIERIEVLRDDVSAQYGSDAIAAVINVVLKQTQSKNTIRLLSRVRSAGDGQVNQVSLQTGNQGLYANLQVRQSDANNVSGLDRRDYYFDSSKNGDYRTTHRYGDPKELSATGIINAHTQYLDYELYAQARMAIKRTQASGFFRRANDDRTIRSIYPDGYLPNIEPTQTDLFTTLGIRTEISKTNIKWSLSNSYGLNIMDIHVTDSVNASLGSQSPTEFDSGTLKYWQNSTNFDLVWPINNALTLSSGGEFRIEKHHIYAGEQASWVDGGIDILDGPNIGQKAAAGAQLYGGFTPENAQSLDRNLAAVYTEADYQHSEQYFSKLALRHEQYSDFGGSTNIKWQFNFKPNNNLDSYFAVGTGFRAPSLQQMNFYRTGTAFAQVGSTIEGKQVGIFPVDHPIARLLGATDLDPEKSLRYGAGLSYNISENAIINADVFSLSIDDRIVLSGSIDSESDIPQDAKDFMNDNSIGSARYFLNAVNSRTVGMNVNGQWQGHINQHPLNLSISYQYNKTQIDDVIVPSELGAISNQVFDRQEQARLTDYLPKHKAIIGAEYALQHWKFNSSLNYYGKTVYVSESEQASTDQWFSAKWTMNGQINYQVNPIVSVSLGGNNLFNTQPDYRRSDPPLNGQGNIFPYRGTSPFGYLGAYYYVSVDLVL